MAVDDLVESIEEILTVDPQAFRDRAIEEADLIMDAIMDGAFDNPQPIVGLEYEFYVVDASDALPGPHVGDDSPTCSLQRVPRRLLEFIRFEKELGLHNAELSTSPLPFNVDGLRAQEAEVAAQLRTANQWIRLDGLRLVSDGMWTIPPHGESARDYLTDSVVERGIRVASNMSAVPRYHAMSNVTGGYEPAMEIDVPNVTLAAETVMPESLITSIQPHYQVPRAADIPTYLRYALRIAGPLLALGVNAPVFPPDLYDADATPETIVREAWMSHRIPIFESVLNPPGGADGKVRFPRDVETVGESVDRIAYDDVLVPMPPSRRGRFDDDFATFRLKHGTYWRWVRPVFEGASRSAANARIEFRPIPAQPTVRDSIAFQATFAGLMSGLPEIDHPVAGLDWDVARENFYDAARDGLEADLRWITRDGSETTDTGEVFEDVLSTAAVGLRTRYHSAAAVDRSLDPLRSRVRARQTPARWKLEQVESAISTGSTLSEAIQDMQVDYIGRQSRSLFDSHFGSWLDS